MLKISTLPEKLVAEHTPSHCDEGHQIQTHTDKIHSYLAMLTSPDAGVRMNGIIHVWALKIREAVPELHRILRSDPDEKVRAYAKYPLAHLSDDIRHQRLYAAQESDFFEDGIRRRAFAKVGDDSRTIVLGGSFVGKAMIRILPKEAYETWKKAFTSDAAWKEAGFTYIPVEPILQKNGKLRVRMNKDGTYSVTCGVLGKSTSAFLDSDPQHEASRAQIFAQQDNIVRVLETLGINHRNTGRENFCVERHGDSFRSYIIDFDLARFLSPVR
jgi:hypothetical protein